MEDFELCERAVDCSSSNFHHLTNIGSIRHGDHCTPTIQTKEDIQTAKGREKVAFHMCMTLSKDCFI